MISLRLTFPFPFVHHQSHDSVIGCGLRIRDWCVFPRSYAAVEEQEITDRSSTYRVFLFGITDWDTTDNGLLISCKVGIWWLLVCSLGSYSMIHLFYNLQLSWIFSIGLLSSSLSQISVHLFYNGNIHFFKGATIFSSSKFLGFMTQEPIFYLLFHKDWYGILLGLQLDL